MNVDFSIGLVEVSGLGDAIRMLDEMCKTADVEFVATERKLGGRLVTIVVKGELTAVKSSVDKGVEMAKSFGTFKASQVIARPHPEILPYLHLDNEDVVPNWKPQELMLARQRSQTATKSNRQEEQESLRNQNNI